MRLPSGFSSKPNKKDLEDHIKLLEEKLKLLNSSIDNPEIDLTKELSDLTKLDLRKLYLYEKKCIICKKELSKENIKEKFFYCDECADKLTPSQVEIFIKKVEEAELTKKSSNKVLPKYFKEKTKTNSQKKGIKLKTLLITIGVIITISAGILSYQPQNNHIESDYHSEPVEVPSSPYTAPVIESMSAQCQKAYNLGPNQWYKDNC